MIEYMKKNGVEVRLNKTVTGFEATDGHITGIRTKGGLVTADSYILATGGKSHPETGCTGEGFGWMQQLGHTVIQPDPALVPIVLKDPWKKKAAGISLKDVKMNVVQDGKKYDSRAGKMLFTHLGLSGPLVLNMSKGIGALLKNGDVLLELDLFPKLDAGALDKQLLTMFERGKNKMIKNAIGEITQPRLGLILLSLTDIPPDTPLRQLTREQRLSFGQLLKRFPMHVAGLLGEDKAIITGGGIDLKEVVFRTMQSKLYKNLFFAGDVLDFDRPSGGFSLQICWTTGFVAGSSTAESKN